MSALRTVLCAGATTALLGSALTACAAGPAPAGSTPNARPAALALSQVAPAAAPPPGSGSGPAAVLARLTEAQRVGQLIMAGAPLGGSLSQTTTDISTYHAGSVILMGRSSAGVSAIRSLTGGLQTDATTAATGGVPLLISTDQEGGAVQVLSGPGFSSIPSALTQGTWTPTTLRTAAATWGAQLAAAGVNVNLAPVLDTVPATLQSTNAPIGVYDRNFANTPAGVASSGTAFIEGLRQAGVTPTVKHFPGLGRASGNTDTTFGVTDNTTTRYDPYVAPYAAGLQSGGAQIAMVSFAIYTRIDPAHPGAYSPTVLSGMLRHDLGFQGIIMTDGLSAVAVSNLTPAQQAVDFIAAGGDMLLATNPAAVPEMASALLARAQTDATFQALVDNSCLRVLIAKQRAGVLGGGVALAAAGGNLYLAQQGSTVALYQDSSTGWSGPVTIGPATSQPPALAAVPGTNAVEFAQLNPADGVSVRRYSPGSLGAWTTLGGGAGGPPAVAVSSSGAVAVAVRGTDDALWLREFTPARGWSGWTSLGGVLASGAPALAYTPTGLDAFVEGTNQAVYERARSAAGWSGWINLGGVVQAPPTATVDPASGQVSLFAPGGRLALWQRTLRTWWTQVPTALVTGPATAAATTAGKVAAVVEGLNGRLYAATRSATGWSGWTRLPFG